MDALPSSEIEQDILSCINMANTILQLHRTHQKEPHNNFMNLSEPESLELIGTINHAKTSLSPPSPSPSSPPPSSSSSSPSRNPSPLLLHEEDAIQFHCMVKGILKTLTSIHDAISTYVAPSDSTWRLKKIKVFRDDFLLRQKTDQYNALHLHAPTQGEGEGEGGDAQMDAIIVDKEGQGFWMEHFKGRYAAPWDTFISILEANQNVSIKQDEFLKNILDFTQDGYVSVYEFSVFLKWFGPLDGCCRRMQEAARSGILCGAVAGVEANMLLEGKPEGYYLVRFSKTQPGAFAITFVDAMNVTKHCLLHHSASGFTLKIPPNVFRTLNEFVTCYKSKLKYPISHTERKILSKSTAPDSARDFTHTRDGPSDNKSIDTRDLCIVCMDAITNTVFLECGHVACCSVCAKPLVSCPVCRSNIARVVQIYRP